MDSYPARASNPDVPYEKALVTLFWFTASGGAEQTHTVDGKRGLLLDWPAEVFAVWTGQYHSDVFVADRADLQARLEGAS